MATRDIADEYGSMLQRGFPLALTAAFAAVLFLSIVLLGGIALFGRASDGEQVANLTLRPVETRRAAEHNVLPARPHGANTNLAGSEAGPSVANGSARPPAPSAGATSAGAPPAQSPPQLPAAIIPNRIEKPVYAGKVLVADPALIESTPQGPLPRIADDGRTPMSAYAPPVSAGTHPRVALVITGLGISARQTAAALEELPPQVTLAFAPYSDDVQRWVGEARRKGHEVLLEVPMEPYDFPDSDPGPHTLRASVSEESNTERLAWSLSRFTGYAGITNLLGGRFLADPDSLAPVMTYLARRGLLFFDSGPEGRSAAPDVARQINAPYVHSTFSVDAIQTAMEIDAKLSELETRARTDNAAAGTGFVYPVTIERVTSWASGLAGRGFVLVPASAIVARVK